MSVKDFLNKRTNREGYVKESDPDIVGLDFNIMRQDYEQGVQRGESTGVPAMNENLSWMRGHQNCWTGWSNDGKALSINELVPTPSGMKQMKDIHIGDIVFDENGKKCNVIYESPIYTDRKLYKFTFNCGTEIDCCEDHLWLTYNQQERKSALGQMRKKERSGINDQRHKTLKPKVRSAKEIFETQHCEKGANHSVRLSKAVDYDFQQTVIDPYLLGVWLADGNTANPGITTGDPEVIERIRKSGYNVSDQKNEYRYYVKDFVQTLRDENLIGNKHIPVNYKVNDYETRLSLLRGIMDSDGSISKTGQCELSLSHEILARDCHELICSLGIKASINRNKSYLNGVNKKDRFRIVFKTTLMIFTLERKVERLPKELSPRQLFRSIRKVEEIPTKPVKCIQVDSPNKLYQCSTSFIATHNTTFLTYMMIMKSLTSGWKWCIWSPEMKQANFVDGQIKTHFNVIAYEMMATMSGKTPYKHISEKYGIPLMSIDQIHFCAEWIGKHFTFLDPKQRDIEYVIKMHKRIYEAQGFDGFLLDPYKNIKAEMNKRDDQHLSDVFSQITEASVQTNSVFNWIAHPKSGMTRTVDVDGGLQVAPCNQSMLSGGAAWDNSMDGIYTPLRPFTTEDLTDNRVRFYNLKQRMQDLTAQRGVVDDITFDIKTRRYMFNHRDPLQGLIVKDGNFELI